jgi:hypothetical protein
LQQSPAAPGDASTAAALPLVLPDGQAIFSRAAVDSCNSQQLQALLLSAAVTDKGAAAQAAAAAAAAAAANAPAGQGSSSMTGAKLKAMQVICQTLRSNMSYDKVTNSYMKLFVTQVADTSAPARSFESGVLQQGQHGQCWTDNVMCSSNCCCCC